MYKLISMNGEVFGACKEENGRILSFTFSDPANTYYQAYLKFIEDGGIPLPAENL